MNGFELMEALNDETHQTDDLIFEVKDVNRRRAALNFSQHKLLSNSNEPQTGIFFWAPTQTQEGWRLDTFFDSQFPTGYGNHGPNENGLDHKTIWKIWATTILGQHETEVPHEIEGAYRGIPRGRVTKTFPSRRGHVVGPAKPLWLILHGNDSPIRDACKLIVSRFNLPDDGYRFEFDNHERTLRPDVALIQRYLGRDLGLRKKASTTVRRRSNSKSSDKHR